VSDPDGSPIIFTPVYEAQLANASAEILAAAEIPIEQCDAPVLLVSGEDDALWPSSVLAEIAVRRARTHSFQHSIRHIRYPQAGHGFSVPAGFPVPAAIAHPFTGDPIALGGSPAGNAYASISSWHEIISFLRQGASGV
jgi:acetyl esterase/lipase